MKLRSILTTRHIQKAIPWQIVWEWEDAVAARLGLVVAEQKPYLNGAKASIFDRLLFRKNIFPFSQMFLGHRDLPALCFHMNPPYIRGWLTRENVIPVIIDCWRSDLARVPEIFGRHKAIFVCNLEAVEILKATAPSLPVHYLPMSIPESYVPKNIPNKDIDLLCYSRTHPDLVCWARRFVAEHPQVRLYRTGTHEGRPILYDGDKKTDLGDSRDAVLATLARSKIVLQSSPGLCKEELPRTGGFSPVTPRFFEAAAHCCHMVGIYPDNKEFMGSNIPDVCQRVGSYAEFYESVERLLAAPFGCREMQRNRDFIRKNSTERRADEIQQFMATV